MNESPLVSSAAASGVTAGAIPCLPTRPPACTSVAGPGPAWSTFAELARRGLLGSTAKHGRRACFDAAAGTYMDGQVLLLAGPLPFRGALAAQARGSITLCHRRSGLRPPARGSVIARSLRTSGAHPGAGGRACGQHGNTIRPVSTDSGGRCWQFLPGGQRVRPSADASADSLAGQEMGTP